MVSSRGRKARNTAYQDTFSISLSSLCPKTAFFYIPIKFYKNKQGLQEDPTRSMEIHSNPVTITFDIDIQLDITFKYCK